MLIFKKLRFTVLLNIACRHFDHTDELGRSKNLWINKRLASSLAESING